MYQDIAHVYLHEYNKDCLAHDDDGNQQQPAYRVIDHLWAT